MFFGAFFLVLLFALPLSARVPKGLEKYDPVRIPKVSLITIGPGPAAFDRFGQTALRVRVEEKRADVFYSYCLLDLAGTSLVDTLRGSLRYKLVSHPFPLALEHFRRLGREVKEQDLNPSLDGAYELERILEDPQNPDRAGYTLDFFESNCTTKVRDRIDAAVSGKLRETWKAKDRQTVRDHVLRTTADAVFTYVALDFLLGPASDQHPEKWDAAFLPQMLERAVEGVQFKGVHGTTSLVKEERQLVQGPKEQIRRNAPDRVGEIWRGNAIAVVLILILGSLAFGGGIASRVAFALALAVWGGAMGLLGTASLLLGLFSKSAFFDWNVNLLGGGPLGLALPVLALGVFRGDARALSRALWVSLVCLGGTVLAYGVGLLPWVVQENGRIVALSLPPWLAFSYSLAKLRYPLFSPETLVRRLTRRG